MTPLLAGRRQAVALARDVRFEGAENVRPDRVGHWRIRAARGSKVVVQYRIMSGYAHAPTVADVLLEPIAGSICPGIKSPQGAPFARIDIAESENAYSNSVNFIANARVPDDSESKSVDDGIIGVFKAYICHAVQPISPSIRNAQSWNRSHAPQEPSQSTSVSVLQRLGVSRSRQPTHAITSWEPPPKPVRFAPRIASTNLSDANRR